LLVLPVAIIINIKIQLGMISKTNKKRKYKGDEKVSNMMKARFFRLLVVVAGWGLSVEQTIETR
jgi:hypothetical protein